MVRVLNSRYKRLYSLAVCKEVIVAKAGVCRKGELKGLWEGRRLLFKWDEGLL